MHKTTIIYIHRIVAHARGRALEQGRGVYLEISDHALLYNSM